jgi:outer membrane lipoprotein-sorting protein
MSTTSPQAGTIETKVWMKGQTKIREELSTQGMDTIILIDMDQGVMYSYIPDQGIATKMTINTSQIPEGAGDPEDILSFNPEVVGTETIDGKSCTVIEWTISGGSVKEWIWTEVGFPLKMETTTSQGVTTVEFKNLDFSNIPDSMFELPEGVQIIEI